MQLNLLKKCNFANEKREKEIYVGLNGIETHPIDSVCIYISSWQHKVNVFAFYCFFFQFFFSLLVCVFHSRETKKDKQKHKEEKKPELRCDVK